MQIASPSVRPSSLRKGFTLVEILVVIVIIGMLAAIAIPAVSTAVTAARETALKLDVTSLADAAERYHAAHGEYPPDMSSWTVAMRHLRKTYPRISAVDITLLYNMCHTASNDPTSGIPYTTATPNPTAGFFNPTAINRGEALVLFLGGLSSDQASPFTGVGGPFEQVATTSLVDPSNYQYNISRDNAYNEFPTARLTLDPSTAGARLVSTDDSDILPMYLRDGGTSPFVYFDSKTYGLIPDPTGTLLSVANAYNGYADPAFGVVRPFKANVPVNAPTGTYGTGRAASLDSWKWEGDKKFQILSAGSDDMFGTAYRAPLTAAQDVILSSDEAVYFIAETGVMMTTVSGATTPSDTVFTNGPRKYQENSNVNGATENFVLDNVSSFSSRTLASDLKN